MGRSVRHFVRDQVRTGTFEQAMRSCACGEMAAAYCWLVHARLRRVQRILPHRAWV